MADSFFQRMAVTDNRMARDPYPFIRLAKHPLKTFIRRASIGRGLAGANATQTNPQQGTHASGDRPGRRFVFPHQAVTH